MKLSQTFIRAASTSAKADNPKFYAMVLDFTKASANILETKLIDESQIKSKLIFPTLTNVFHKLDMTTPLAQLSMKL